MKKAVLTWSIAARSVALLGTVIAGLSANSVAGAQSEAFPRSNVPQAYLELISTPRAVTFRTDAATHTRLYNLITKQNDIPNLMSPCRMKPVEIAGLDPLTHASRLVHVMDYAVPGSDESKMKTILLMPPTGGENALDDAYANHLCTHGFRVVLVQHWASDISADLDLDTHDRGAMRSTAAVKDVITYISPRGPKQLGILGTSVGAITSALILGVDARVSTGVLIVGGGGMPEIIGKSTEKTLSNLREARRATPSLNVATMPEYIAALKDHVRIEPLAFSRISREKNILMFLATQDITVPTYNQFMLYHAFGDQELITYDADHLHTILHTCYKEKTRITEFFDRNLVAP